MNKLFWRKIAEGYTKQCYLVSYIMLGFPGGSDSKESAWNAGDPSLIPGLGRSPGEGQGYPLQYFCLESPVDRGAWWGTVYGVAKSGTWLKKLSTCVAQRRHRGQNQKGLGAVEPRFITYRCELADLKPSVPLFSIEMLVIISAFKIVLKIKKNHKPYIFKN